MFDRVISFENLFVAWKNFARGKMSAPEIAAFSAHLEDHLFELHETLRAETYRHRRYEQFFVHDPKRRLISAATIRDRVAHQAIVQVIQPIFEGSFIFDSFASRKGKGVHAAVCRLDLFLRQASRNYTRPVYALKCDIRKFFVSVRHDVLMKVIRQRITDYRLCALINQIVSSYATGLPLGNLTSQLFTNIYLDAFDHFVKERLKFRWYARFCDDFVLVHPEREKLEETIPLLHNYLWNERSLLLHPHKTRIRKFSEGVDFVGQVLRPHYRTLRLSTKKRLFKRTLHAVDNYKKGNVSAEFLSSSLQSASGLLGHGSNYATQKVLWEEATRSLTALL